MSMRLPGKGLVEGAKPVTFSFNGRHMMGLEGDTLASALLANGVHLVGRSFKYHRPRGILTAGSEEPNALVTVGSGEFADPNVRATTQELFEGLSASSQNCWPSVETDLMAVNDLAAPFLGAGFYYKTFMWPAAFWEKLYEPMIRRAAGLGALSGAADPDCYEKAYAFCDLLVIGSGPAGLMAALVLALREARVIEAKTSNAEYHQRLGLTEGEGNDSALRVSIKAADGGFGVLFGNKVGSDQLVRFTDQDQVWLVNRALSMSSNPQDWLDLQVSQIPLEQIATAHWRYSDGEELQLDKASEGDYNFKLTDGEANGHERELNSMVLALADLRAQNISLRTALQLGEPVLTMQLSSWSGATLEASLYELGGAYWLTIDGLGQSDENPLTVNADPRWAFQLGVAQHDRMVLRHADLKPAEDTAAQPAQN